MLQDVDVIDLQPGLGHDLVGRPTLHIPAVDDVRLALRRMPCSLAAHPPCADDDGDGSWTMDDD